VFIVVSCPLGETLYHVLF